MELTGNIIIDINNFEELSRKVGYFNCKANHKEYDVNNDVVYDEESIKKYEKLRLKQLKMQNDIIKLYSTKNI